MSRNTTTTLTWTLTVIPEISPRAPGRIDHASFHYGRTNDEIATPYWTDVKSLPSGILRVVKESEIEGNALEAGFVIEMSSHHKQKSEGWFTFQCALLASKKGSSRRRGVYVCAETAKSMEMMNLSCCPPKELPKVIWVRVSALPEKTLAWVLSSTLKESASTQMSLGDFSDLGPLPPPASQPPLVLPGPPNSPYEFL
tara:strand:- start:374 stop:967 length:594 start_codon:yes stop_codon:yes gene_type:complete